MNKEVAASIADALMDDSGPDLDSLINRMLTLMPGCHPSSDMSQIENSSIDSQPGVVVVQPAANGTMTSNQCTCGVVAPNPCPCHEQPLAAHANGDTCHSEAAGDPSRMVAASAETPAPVAPPRHKMLKSSDPVCNGTTGVLFRFASFYAADRFDGRMILLCILEF